MEKRRPGFPRHRFKMIEKLRERKLTHKQRSRIFRSLVILAGFVITLAGVIMLVTPGPAFALIPVGLYLLALEFDWAERWLEKALEHAQTASNNPATKKLVSFVKRRPRTSAAILAILLTLVGAAVAAALHYDVPAKLRVL